MATTNRRRAVAAILLGLICGLSVIYYFARSPDSDIADTRVLLDLAAEFRLAQIQRETEFVDLPSQGARVLFGDGQVDIPLGASTARVWSIGDSSSVDFYTSTGKERVLVASGEPFLFPGAPTQRVDLSVNGTSVGEIALAPDVGEVRWTIPSSVLRIGQNRLTFSYGYSRAPKDVLPGSLDSRPLAVSWDWIRFEATHSASVPSLDAESQIVLPFRSQVDYFLSLPAGSILELGAVKMLPAAMSMEPTGTSLIVEVEHDLNGTITEHRLTPSTEPQRLPLNEPAGVVRLSLRGLQGRSTAAGTDSALRLSSVRVVAPENDVPTAATGDKEVSLSRPNILVFVVDTLRADALGAYSARPGASPRIDAFARNAILFSNARANSSWTRPGVASLITGQTPWQHGVRETKDGLSPLVETMAEIFKRADYSTAGFITNGNINREFGFAQGFDRYVALPEDTGTRSLHRDSADLRNAAISWLAQRSDERPFFLYLHASDPHAPYAPPSPQAEHLISAQTPALETINYITDISRLAVPVDADNLSRLKTLYQAEVQYVDEQFGLLLDELESRKLLHNTIVVFTSDHGEEFYDHNWWQHGKTLYGEQLRIPMIIKLHKERTGVRSERLIEQIDLLPTLLGQAGIPVPDAVSGRDALSDQWHDRPALALLHKDGRHLESVIDGQFKLIETQAYEHPRGITPGVQLFDLYRDPSEQHNLALERPVRVGYLRSVMHREKASLGNSALPEAIEIDAETERTLRALGYIE